MLCLGRRVLSVRGRINIRQTSDTLRNSSTTTTCPCKRKNKYLAKPSLIHCDSKSFLHQSVSVNASGALQNPKSESYAVVTISKDQTTNLYRRRQFSSSSSGSFAPFISAFREEANKGGDENLSPLDQFVFQISSDTRRKGRVSRRDVESAINLIESGTSVGDHGTFILTCLGSSLPNVGASDKIAMAQKVWNAIGRERKQSFESFDALLRIYCSTQSETSKKIPGFDGSELLEELKTRLSESPVDGMALKPSQKTYYYVLLSYCLKGDINNAIKVLNMVKDEGIPVDEDYFNALIIGNARSGDIKGAEGILEIMKAVNIEPSEKTFAALMQAYIEDDNIIDLERIYSFAITRVSFPQRRILKLLRISAQRNTNILKKILSWVTPSEKINSDLVNTAVFLVHSGFPTAALDLLIHFTLPSSVDTADEPIGTFLLKEMVIADVELPVVTIVCDTLVEKGLNRHAWNAAAEYSLKYNKSLSYSIFENMIKRNIPVRPHYFWPILVQQTESAGTDGMLGVIEKMHSFNVPCDWETLCDFIVPKMFAENKDALHVAKILKESANLSYSSGVLKAMLLYLLKQKRFRDASYLVKKIRGTLDEPQCLIDVLYSGLLKFEERENIQVNLELALPILKSIYENAPNEDKRDYVGNFVIRIVEAVGVGLVDMVNKFIQGIQSNEICLSADAVRLLEAQKHLKMCDLKVDEELVFVEEFSKTFLKPKEMNARDLASHAEELRAKDMNERGTLRHLFFKYCQTNELRKVLELKQRFEAECGPLSPGMSSALLGVYIRGKRLDLAKDLFQYLRSTHESLEIDLHKIIDLATLMAENNLTQDAFNLLLVECGSGDANFKKCVPKSIVRNVVALLEAFHQRGSDELKDVLDFLLEKELVEPGAPVLGVMIKHLLVKKDLPAAVNLFIEYAKAYRVTPCQQQLTCSVLDHKDLLEKVLSVCRERYGEFNTKHNLAFAYSDVGKVSEAAEILYELAQHKQLNYNTITKQVEFHGTRRETRKILNLINAISKGVPTYDSSFMYLTALKTCEITRDSNDVRLVLSNIHERDRLVPSNVLRYAERLKKYSYN